MKTKFIPFAMLAVLLAAGALMWTGCDQTYSDDREIIISPAMASFTNYTETMSWVQTFYAGEYPTDSESTTNGGVVASSNLFYPLEWSVSDPSLGIILDSTGNSAVYRTWPGVVGVNIVYCRDQSGREGQASAISTYPLPTNLVSGI